MPDLKHLYFSTAKLNAQYDLYPPLQNIGAGSLAQGSLGSLGGGALVDDPTNFPWRESSSSTRELQQLTNKTLVDAGYCPIAVDGVLGPATCGAVRTVIEELGISDSPPSTCQEFTDPKRAPCGGGGARPVIPPSDTTLARQPSSGGGNWLLIGGLVAAAAIGGALVLKKRKGR